MFNYFVTVEVTACDDFIPEYFTKWFRTKEAMEAYIVSLDDEELYAYGKNKEWAELPF